MVRCARAMTRPGIPLLAVPWMRAFEWRCVCVCGVFTCALREADRRCMDAYSVREKQGLVPDLQLDDSHYPGTSSRAFAWGA
jgi:hypothetical protein